MTVAPAGTRPGVLPPAATAIRELVAMLTGCAVSAHEELLPVVTPADVAAAGVYFTEAGHVVAALLLDLGLAAAIGASLSMMPRARVEESVHAGRVLDDLVPNLAEVLDVSASLVNAEGRPHVVHRRLYLAPDVPAGLLAAAEQRTRRTDCTVQVDGYGGGRVAVVSA